MVWFIVHSRFFRFLDIIAFDEPDRGTLVYLGSATGKSSGFCDTVSLFKDDIISIRFVESVQADEVWMIWLSAFCGMCLAISSRALTATSQVSSPVIISRSTSFIVNWASVPLLRNALIALKYSLNSISMDTFVIGIGGWWLGKLFDVATSASCNWSAYWVIALAFIDIRISGFVDNLDRWRGCTLRDCSWIFEVKNTKQRLVAQSHMCMRQTSLCNLLASCWALFMLHLIVQKRHHVPTQQTILLHKATTARVVGYVDSDGFCWVGDGAIASARKWVFILMR